VKHKSIKASLSAALTILLLSASFANAAQIRQPDGPVNTDPGNNKPVVDFDPDIWTEMAKKDPYAGVDCAMWTNPSIGYPLIWLFNHSGKTIPAGSTLTWTLPGGKTVTITNTYPIPPGGGMAINATPAMEKMADFSCSIKVDWTPARVL
jgi:hypothetical protein